MLWILFRNRSGVILCAVTGVIVNYCDKLESEGLLIRLIDKDLDPKGEDELLSHLRSCPDCLGKIAQLLLTEQQLDEVLSGGDGLFPDNQSEEETEDPYKLPPDLVVEEDDVVSGDPLEGMTGLISVDDLPVGAQLEQNIYDNRGKLLIGSNTPLSRNLIDSIKRLGITMVTVRPSKTTVDTAYIAEARAFTGKPDREFYMALAKGGAPVNVSEIAKQVAVESLKKAFSNTGMNASIDIDEVRDTCEDIVGELIDDDIVSPSIIDMYLIDSSLYHHSINVLVMFTSICSTMDLPVDTVKAYAVGAMLHDIGRVFLRKVAVKERVRDLNIDRVHPEAGYKYLRGMGGLDEGVLTMVRNHHERFDGRGFPRGIDGEELGFYGQALVLANYYDNLTWDRSRKIKANFHQAAKAIIQQGRKLVDNHVINAFLNIFGHYPPGSWVELNSGQAGLVVQGTPFKPRSPIIHVYYESSGKRLPEVIPLNLSGSGMPHITGHFTPSQ